MAPNTSRLTTYVYPQYTRSLHLCCLRARGDTQLRACVPATQTRNAEQTGARKRCRAEKATLTTRSTRANNIAASQKPARLFIRFNRGDGPAYTPYAPAAAELCTRVRAHVRAHARVCARAHTHTRTSTHICTRTRARTRVCTRAYACTRVHAPHELAVCGSSAPDALCCGTTAEPRVHSAVHRRLPHPAVHPHDRLIPLRAAHAITLLCRARCSNRVAHRVAHPVVESRMERESVRRSPRAQRSRLPHRPRRAYSIVVVHRFT